MAENFFPVFTCVIRCWGVSMEFREGLEIKCARKGTGGSNPSLSARKTFRHLPRFFHG